MIFVAALAAPAETAVDHSRRAAAARAARLLPVPVGQRGRSGRNVAFIVGELVSDFPQIVYLALGESLNREDRGGVQQAEQPVPLAVVFHERLGHPQLAAAAVGGES